MEKPHSPNNQEIKAQLAEQPKYIIHKQSVSTLGILYINIYRDYINFNH